MSADPMDLPEDDGMELAFPFTACQSEGGPYDDDAFVAGYQCGQVDRSLAALAAVGGTTAHYTVLTTLARQLELVGMHHGFPDVTVEQSEEVPEWSFVTFAASKEGL